MARPTIDLPYWAVQDVTLAVAGTTNKIEPKTSLQQYGWDKKEQPSCQELNWYFNAVYQWIAYLDTVSNSATSEATANTVVLRDSTAGFKAGAIQATSLTISSLKNTGSTTTYGSIINYGIITNSGKETHSGAQVFSSTINSTGVNTFSGVNTFNNSDNVFYGTFTGNLTGNVTGNASTATKLASAFDLYLTGSVTGAASIDGSGNVTLTTTSSDVWDYSTATNGYIKFPNGLIMQWGYNAFSPTWSSITFPTPFTTACYNVQATLIVSSQDDYELMVKTGSVSKTGFQWSSYFAGTAYGYWMAIGY